MPGPGPVPVRPGHEHEAGARGEERRHVRPEARLVEEVDGDVEGGRELARQPGVLCGTAAVVENLRFFYLLF